MVGLVLCERRRSRRTPGLSEVCRVLVWPVENWSAINVFRIFYEPVNF